MERKVKVDNLWRIWWNVSNINFRYVPTLDFPSSHLDIYFGKRSSFLALDQSSRRCYPNRDKVSDDERAPKCCLELFWTVIPYFRVMPVDELHLSVCNRLFPIELQIQGYDRTQLRIFEIRNTKFSKLLL